jgi:VIT1/CCC1 family predicted Fe2+/Mn2+ transporter
MIDENTGKRRRILDPVERSMEILFGLIMVLTFTCSLSAASAGREEIRTMIIAALGCNLAWGIVDGVMYLLNTIAERGRALHLLRGVQQTRDASQAHRTIADALPAAVASILSPAELDSIHGRLRQLPAPPARARLNKDDYLGALGVLILVFLSTLPVIFPFLLFQDTVRALRFSNGIAIALLFIMGYRLGKFSDNRPWITGFGMMGIGVGLVAITMALGG